MLVLIPLLLLALPLPPTKGKWAVHKKDWVFAGAVAIGALSLAAYLLPTPLFPRRKSTLPLLLLGTSLLLIANCAWNQAYRGYVDHHNYRREVFRKAMRNFWAPVYGRYDNALARWDQTKRRYSFATFPWAVLSIGIAGGWYVWARRRPPNKSWDARSLAVLLSFELALIIAFAACEPWPTRFSLHISGYSEFAHDLHRFTGVGSILHHYVERMPTLKWYGQHYPPGNLILLMIEKNLGIPGLTKTIVCLCTILSAIPLLQLARELELDATATSAALLLFTASTGVLIYCTINSTSLLLLPTTLCLWMLLRGLRTGSVVAGVVLGLSFLCYLFFSLSAAILGILMALITAIGWWNGAFSSRNVLRTGVIALATLIAGVELIRVTTHFDLLRCCITAVHGHQAQQGNEGFDDLRRYLLRSSGNVIAYLMSIVPLSILAVSALRSAKPQATRAAKALFVALWITVVIAGFSGLFYVETERIWIFFTPVFALAAGFELARRGGEEESRVIWITFLLVLLISCSQELLFMHYR